MRTRLLMLLILSLACARAHAVDIYACYNGSSEQGGWKIKTNGIEASQYVQRSFITATTTVYVHGTVTLATIYTDAAGSIPLANPFSSSTHGVAFFCAADGFYDIQYSNGGIPTPFTVSDIHFNFSGGGGGGSPGGSNTQLQFNDATAFGGATGLTWNKSTNTFTIVNGTTLNYSGSGAGQVTVPVTLANFSNNILAFQMQDTASSLVFDFPGFNGGSLQIFGNTSGASGATLAGIDAGGTKGGVIQVGSFSFSCNGVSLSNGGWLVNDVTNVKRLCGDATGIYGPTPAAGDSSHLVADTIFLTIPGPIGSVTPNSGKFTVVNITGLAINTGVCTDGSSNLTTSGCPGGGGSGTVGAGANLAVPYYNGAGTSILGDAFTSLDGGGHLNVQSITLNQAGTGILTVAQGTGIANPASSLASVYVDSITNNLTCILHSGASCLTLPGAPGGSNGSLQFNNSAALGGSTCIYNGSNAITCPSTSVQADTLLGGVGCPNDTVTGTTQNKLATVTSAKCIKTTTGQVGLSDTYLIVSGAGTTGNSYPLAGGLGSCVFDAGGNTAGHLFGVSTTTAGDCKDLGTSDITTLSSGLWVGGISTTTNAGTGTYAVIMSQGQVTGGTGGGGGNMSTTTTNTMAAAGTIDASGETGADPFKVPVKAAFTAGANGSLGVDSSAGKLHTFLASADRVICTTQGESGCVSSGGGPPSQSGNSSTNLVRTTGDVTTTSASLVAITGLNWTLPASTATNLHFTCDIMFTDSTSSSSAVAWAVQDVTTAPTNGIANALMQTNTSAFTAGSVSSITTTGTQQMVSAQPATTNPLSVRIFGTIEQPSGSASVFQIMASIASAATLTVKRDSTCTLQQVSN